MLSSQERRVLAETARRLGDDELFARRMRWPRGAEENRGVAAGLAVALLAMVACAVAQLAVAALGCAVAAVLILGYAGGRTWAHRRGDAAPHP